MTDFRAYAQLVRLPNLPSALADICLGVLAAHALPEHGFAFLLVLLSSSCLYSAGMVWNDYFDREQDRRERPFRPLPSGRVSPRQAVRLGAILLLAGMILGRLAGATSGWVAVGIAGMVLLYDGLLKRTCAGPVAMGACRFLNVLLGVSACGSLRWPLGGHLALVVGVYIVGVTWLARTEARQSNANVLRGAASVMLAALALAVPLRLRGQGGSDLSLYLLVGLGFFLGMPIVRAIALPTPSRVQAAVRRALLGLILLDTVLAVATAGLIGLLIVPLILPSLYLNRKSWLYAT